MLLSTKMNSVEDFASQSIKEKNDKRSVESECFHGEGKLSIELKVPKEHGGEEVMEDTDHPNIDLGLLHKDGDKHRACDLCNKTFKSGKALGGHMRIHSQKGKKTNLVFKLKPHQSVKFKNQNPYAAEEDTSRVTNSSKNKKKKTSSHKADDCAGGSDIDVRTSCPVCGKIFPSAKSVFGHMRKHSDRNWRGSRPPSTEKASSSSCLSFEENPENGDRDELLSDIGKDGVVDLTIYLRGWNPRARRGRKRLSSEMDAFQSDEHEVAASMMMLRGEDYVSELEHKHDEFEDVKSYNVSLNDDIQMLIKKKKASSSGPSSSSQDIDLNKLPAPSDSEAEAGLP